jgi:tRNA(Ile)-lysidine synthase
MLDQVIDTIARHRMLSPGDRVVAAVSGGPDSVCLLDVLSKLAPRMGIIVAGVAHLNHKLRGEASDEDERFVAAVGQRYGIPCCREQANLTGEGNLEEDARQARQRFFARLIREGVADKVATGHTLDDQAETVLFRLLRGSGPAGMSGVLPVTSEGLIRPLLEVTHAEVEEYLKSCGIEWRQDATNFSSRFSRNRIRHELLPLLKSEWNPRIPEALARYADIAQEEERWWEAEIALVAGRVLEKSEGGVEASASTIAELPRGMARRLVRHAFREVRRADGQPDFDHVECVRELAGRREGEGKVEFAGVEVIRSFGRLRFQRAGSDPSLVDVPVQIPGRYSFGRAFVCFEVACFDEREDTRTAHGCASLKLKGLTELKPLELRSWRVGDRYHPVGRSRSYTLHELFQRAQVPSWRRHAWPIVASDSQIVWVRVFGVASGFAAETGTSPVLRIWEENVSKR